MHCETGNFITGGMECATVLSFKDDSGDNAIFIMPTNDSASTIKI